VISPIVDSPGERAGLRPGDVITHVDGQSLRGVSLGEAIRLIRGPRGSPVILTIVREGSPPQEVSVVRDQIRVQAVRGEVRSDGIAYIRISTFGSGVGGQLRRTLEDMKPQTPIGWILDLRGNPGGTLDGAISVASQFLPEGVVLYEQGRDGDKQEIRRRGETLAGTGPMAVLVD
jgi:carboxyl-terminal processing protease